MSALSLISFPILIYTISPPSHSLTFYPIHLYSLWASNPQPLHLPVDHHCLLSLILSDSSFSDSSDQSQCPAPATSYICPSRAANSVSALHTLHNETFPPHHNHQSSTSLPKIPNQILLSQHYNNVNRAQPTRLLHKAGQAAFLFL